MENKENIKLCVLCKSRNADHEGSHLIPDFILRSMLVKGETNKRSEKTFGYQFNDGGASMFIGRGINDIEAEKLIGRKYTEEDQASNVNSYIVKNVFCCICENRLSFIETLFKQTFYDKLKLTKSGNIFTEFKDDCELFKLFWISVLFRLSIVRFGSFSLGGQIDERFRNTLDMTLGSSIQETFKLLERNKILINNETIGVLFANDVDTYLNNLVILNPNMKIPYTLIINDFYVFYYCKPKHINNASQSMFYLDGIFSKSEYINSSNCKSIRVGIIPKDRFIKSKTYLLERSAGLVLKNFTLDFSKYFSFFHSRKPTAQIMNEFVRDVVDTKDTAESERYTYNRLFKKMDVHIKKHM